MAASRSSASINASSCVPPREMTPRARTRCAALSVSRRDGCGASTTVRANDMTSSSASPAMGTREHGGQTRRQLRRRAIVVVFVALAAIFRRLHQTIFDAETTRQRLSTRTVFEIVANDLAVGLFGKRRFVEGAHDRGVRECLHRESALATQRHQLFVFVVGKTDEVRTRMRSSAV